jgi:Uncharacterized protein conserved in bacteria
MDIKEVSSLALAFVGDAHYSTKVREYLVRSTFERPNRLQRLSTRYVSAKAQASIMSELLNRELLTELEMDIYKRGRNAKSNSVPKNTDVQTYHISTGFEALWGYWYLSGEEKRLEQIWNIIKTIVEE